MSTVVHARPSVIPRWSRHSGWFAFVAGLAFLVPYVGVSVLDLQHEVYYPGYFGTAAL